MIKYPRTQHIEGSRLQTGDDDLEVVRFTELADKYLIIEEKIDGSNVGVSFDNYKIFLQSRGHQLTGGPRERQWDLFKSWANTFSGLLWDLLGNRYVMYGEWMYAMHTEFYDALPHYFLEFDIWDKEKNEFLSTERRRQFLEGLPIVSVPVLVGGGKFSNLEAITKLIGPSLYKSAIWNYELLAACEEAGVDFKERWAQTDQSLLSEGLYIKWEEDGIVKGRYKFVRPEFFQTIMNSESHWMDRPLVVNRLRSDVDIWKW